MKTTPSPHTSQASAAPKSQRAHPSQKIEPSDQNVPASFDEVYFFSTCVVNTFASHAGVGAVKILEKLGVTVHIPPNQTCCGQPAYNAGFPAEARKVARRQLDLFPKDLPIVIPSGSCAAMMKHHLNDIFSSAPSSVLTQVTALSNRIIEWNDFIVKRLYYLDYLDSLASHSQPSKDSSAPRSLTSESPVASPFSDKGAPTTVIFHPSCHSLREMHVSTQAFNLLAKLAHVTTVHLPHENECCGFGGLFAIRHPTISTAMGDNKIDEIIALQQNHPISALLSNDFSCLLHLGGRLKRRHLDLRVCHIAEFIAERIL